MSDDHKSGCPINLTLEVLGDKWSLLIIRDMMFGNKRHFRELLRSEERISSNILADRLRTLLEQGIITKADDPTHMQKSVYSLTEKGIELLPVLAQMSAWGRRYLPVTEELSIRAELLEQGGPKLWRDFMAELRETHLGATRRPRGKSVAARLRAAYEAMVVRKSQRAPSPMTSADGSLHAGSAQAGGPTWQASSGTPMQSGRAAARTAKATSPRRARP